MEERDRILSDLPRIDCGACGAPSCLAFAEDVVLGEALEESCILYWQRSVAARVEELASLVRRQKMIDAGGQK
jgi:Na+-translocating ferredoxin:NAD+ oxidoreductase RNF subunit RnfB